MAPRSPARTEKSGIQGDCWPLSEHLRRLLETAAKLREAMRQDRDLDAMMRGVVAEIAKEVAGMCRADPAPRSPAS